MALYNQITSKKEIHIRFTTAIYAILKNRLISSKTGLAESLGIKPSKFSEILNGRMGVGVDLAAKICDEYYVSPEWLLMGRGKRVFCETINRPNYWIDDCDLIQDPAADSLEQQNQQPLSEMSETLYNKTLEQAELIGVLKARIRELESKLSILTNP